MQHFVIMKHLDGIDNLYEDLKHFCFGYFDPFLLCYEVVKASPRGQFHDYIVIIRIFLEVDKLNQIGVTW